MVARISPGKSLQFSLNYNENKVKQNVAKLIHSANYGKDTELLGWTDKLKTLQKLTALNERTKLNSIHISLNFHPSEKLSEDTLREIADLYMERIGFAQQPYLVYEHHDASHPHIHILTTNIQASGERIDLHNLGKVQSSKARLEINEKFNLVRGQKEEQVLSDTLRRVKKVVYGAKSPGGIKRAVGNVLNEVLSVYKFTSLPELNAVLRGYNVMADQGGKTSRIANNNGLVYRVLDDQGNKTGVPIPASAIYCKPFDGPPTMKLLKPQFSLHETARAKHRLRIVNQVELAFIHRPALTLQDLQATLLQAQIQLVLWQNAKGIIYGTTYVDHQSKCVFNGNALGKAYSANQLLQRLGVTTGIAPSLSTALLPTPTQENRSTILSDSTTARPMDSHQTDKTIPQRKTPLPDPQHHAPTTKPAANVSPVNGLQELLQPEPAGGLNPELQKEEQKKKRKKLRH